MRWAHQDLRANGREQAAKTHTLGHDDADQLKSGIVTNSGPPTRYAHADDDGNRTADQYDDVVTGASYRGTKATVAPPSGVPLAIAAATRAPYCAIPTPPGPRAWTAGRDDGSP